MDDHAILWFAIPVANTTTANKLTSYRSHVYLKAYLLREKDGLYMLVLLASPRWRWCPGEYLLVPYGFRFCMQPANIRQDTSATKPTYRAHLFDQVSTHLMLPCRQLGNTSPKWGWRISGVGTDKLIISISGGAKSNGFNSAFSNGNK